jgi:8-oxo-dGTP pyrophosphatase MutT (NUDIX family)
LVSDLRHALAVAPRDKAVDRFEAWAWRALLDEDGVAILTRAAHPSHFTASGVVLSPDGTHTCLVLHSRAKLWLQPGGHFEPEDVSVVAAALREVREETSLIGTPSPIGTAVAPLQLSRHLAPCHPEVDWHLDLQYLVVAEHVDPVLSEESDAVGWWPVDALPEPTTPGIREMIDLARQVLAG